MSVSQVTLDLENITLIPNHLVGILLRHQVTKPGLDSGRMRDIWTISGPELSQLKLSWWTEQSPKQASFKPAKPETSAEPWIVLESDQGTVI